MRLEVQRISVRDLLVAGFAFVVLVLSLSTAKAQSGRRSTNSPATAPSVSGTKTIEKKPAAKPQLMLLVGIEDRNAFSSIPYYLSDTVLDNCVRHLGEATDVNPKSLGRGVARSDAIARAKAEKDLFVVWLQLGSDLEDSGKQSKKGPDELYVRYTIFEPVTGKVKQAGRTHKQIYRVGRGGVSAPTSSKNNPLYSEYAVKQAAQEAAERVLEAFDLVLRSGRW